MKIDHGRTPQRFLVYFFITVVFLLSQSMAWVSPAFSQKGPADPVRRALLIGVGKYQGLPRLPGSKNDIELVHQVLQTRYGFSDKHIRILRDEEATRANMLMAFREFVKEVGPNDIAYIHYSGHGSQVEDVNGDESGDQLDETIVPYDGRTPGVPDITDDELEKILSELKTKSAVVVLDSCHSGTATRGLEVRVRSVPLDTRVSLYKDSVVRTRAIVPLISARYVLMSGAASNEEALDGPVDGQYHGFFTHSLFKSLQTASRDASVTDIFGGAKKELKRIQNQFGRSSMPEPQLEAPERLLSQPLFVQAGDVASQAKKETKEAQRPWVKVHSQAKGNILLSKAVALGGLPGSVWGIYSQSETRFTAANAKAFATVVSAQGDHAVARVQPSGFLVQEEERASLIAPAFPSGRVPVRLRSVPAESRSWLKDELSKRLGDIELVGEGAFARFVIDVKDKTLRIYSADAATEVASLPVSRNAQTADALAQVLVRSRNASSLLAMENPAAQMALDVRVVQVSDRGIAVVSDSMAAPTYRIRHAGQPRTLTNSLQLEISTDTDCYITIMDVDAEGNVNVLFPNPYQKNGFHPNGLVPAHKAVLIPDSLGSGNRAGFHFDYANPPGLDTIRVFASTDLQLAKRIRRAVQPGNTGGQLQPTLVGTPMTQLASLRQELVGSSTRGLITVPDVPMEMPTEVEAPDPGQMVAAASEVGDRVGSQEVEEFVEEEEPLYEEQVAQEDEVFVQEPIASDFPAIPVTQNIPDWTAVSVTVLVGE